MRIARASRDLLAEPIVALASGVITYEHVRAIERATHRTDDPDEAAAAVELRSAWPTAWSTWPAPRQPPAAPLGCPGHRPTSP